MGCGSFSVKFALVLAVLAVQACLSSLSAQSLSTYGLWDNPDVFGRAPGSAAPSYPPQNDFGAFGGGYQDGQGYGSQPVPYWEPADPADPTVAYGGERPEIVPLAPPLVAFQGPYDPNSIVIDTSERRLYYINGDGTAFVYPISVGKEGFAWQGTESVSRIAWWPDWYPPEEMRQRKPGLPVKMLGGVLNPLGALAIYLGNSLYRIHGTDAPKTIGRAESSGCFRMLNENVVHLAARVPIGTKVVVAPMLDPSVVVAQIPEPAPAVRPTSSQASSGGLFDTYWW